jgi:predicted RNA-binding Zn ribbon-like protein
MVLGVNTYELIAGHPALDAVNTLDWRFRAEGPEELLKNYSDLLAFTAQAKALSPKQAKELLQSVSNRSGERVLKSCRELREAIADVCYAALDERSPAGSSLKTLELHFKDAHQHQKLSWQKPRLEWDWSGSEHEAELPLWILALSASHLMTSDAMRMMRACGSPECRWLFLDTSKNHTRRWCDMKICGNRMKARRFKAQRVCGPA